MNTYSICLGVIFVAVMQSTLAQSPPSVCSAGNLKNGIGFNNHPTECDKYVQCRNDGSGVITPVIQQCAFSTYWENSILTCVPVKQSTCRNDKCANQQDGEIRGAEGNCRGYWQCAENQSEPMCCPVGQRYNESDVFKGCIDADITECNDTCFNDNVVATNNSTTFNETTVEEVQLPVCDNLRYSDVIGMYEELVPGWGWMKRPCAAGSNFVKTSCGCTDRVEAKMQQRICRAELHLPFDRDHVDTSLPAYHVANDNVEVVDGVAKFNGIDSRLIIPRFTNLEHRDTVIIKVKYSSNHTFVQGRAQAIVSNGACKNMPSIVISEDESFVHFVASAPENKFAFANVGQLNKREKDVTYEFYNGTLVGSNGVDSDAVPATAYLRNARCALHIGGGGNLLPFKGEIDELTIFLCKPAMP